jgi:polyphosphate kinase 2 (PPK2 family)
MLDDNRVKILKFFLHVSRDEQAKRLRDRLSGSDEELEVPRRRPR